MCHNVRGKLCTTCKNGIVAPEGLNAFSRYRIRPAFRHLGQTHMNNRASAILRASFAMLLGTLVIGAAGSLLLVSTNRVSSNSTTLSNSWEPSSSFGGTWIHSWVAINDTVTSGHSLVSAWGGSSWNSPVTLTAPTGRPVGDVYLEWDSTRNRFVFCAVDLAVAYPNIWYGYSNDSAGSSWTFRTSPAMAATISYGWDYPSIGVDAAGRIVIGAVQIPGDSGFHTVVSNDGGTTFSSPALVPTTSSAGYARGPRSRVVATSNTFYAFVPVLQDASPYLPVGVERYQSSDGKAWSGPSTLASFGAPLNSSPSTYCSSQGCYSVYYAPLLDARGSTNGQWVVAIPVNNGGYNNIYMCASDRGCGFINAANNDQFLAGASVTMRPGQSQPDYWFSYLTYSSAGTRALPLAVQAVYVPASGSTLGATVSSGVDPTAWLIRTDRCIDTCYTAGDYAGIASNASALASAPFVQRDSPKNNLFQDFIQASQSPTNLTVNQSVGAYAFGSNLQPFAGSVLAQSRGLDLRRIRGVLDQQALGLQLP